MQTCGIDGNLTKDPELKTTTSGRAVCNFNIAVERNFQKTGADKEVDFFNVVVWGKQGESAAKYLRKGSEVRLRGSFQNRSYQDKDGKTRWVTEFVADLVKYGKNPNHQSEDAQPDPSQPTPMAGVDDSDMHEINEDLPF